LIRTAIQTRSLAGTVSGAGDSSTVCSEQGIAEYLQDTSGIQYQGLRSFIEFSNPASRKETLERLTGFEQKRPFSILVLFIDDQAE
jgi:hypothetical protein